MPVDPRFQPIIDDLNADAAMLGPLAVEVGTKITNPPLPEGAISPQDATDTLAALTTAQEAEHTAAENVNATVNPPAPAPAA